MQSILLLSGCGKFDLHSICRPDSDETFTILECAVQIHSRIVCACQAYDKKDPVDLF